MPVTHAAVTDDGVDLAWRLEVPRPQVWRCLTEPGLVGQWLGELTGGEVAQGSDFEIEHGDGYRCCSTVSTFVEAERLSFSWRFLDEPPSAVAISLEEAVAGVELRLTHTELGHLAESYRVGWCVHLAYLEAVALDSSLPASMFWRLHATVAHLAGRGDAHR